MDVRLESPPQRAPDPSTGPRARFCSRLGSSLLGVGLCLAACGDDSVAGGTSEDETTGTTGETTEVMTTGDGSSSTGEPEETTGTTGGPVGDGLFSEGCPEPGFAHAREVQNPDVRMTGPKAVGGAGDVLMMNEHAAFMIQGVDRDLTYYHYGGTVVDAIAVDGCEQANDERFEEVGLLLAELDIEDFPQSTLRAFRAESIEVINDGSDGEAAHVRVHGVDDRYWLVEYELIKQAFKDGAPKPVSEPLGVALTVDYTLAPDSSALVMDLSLRNELDQPQSLLGGATVLFGDRTSATHYYDGQLPLGGYTVDMGIPWVLAASDDGAGSYAFAIAEANFGAAEVAGVNAMIDLDQVLQSPLALGPAGAGDDTASMRFLLAVGGGDGNTAVRGLHAHNPRPIPTLDAYELAPVHGEVRDAQGEPVAGASIEVQMQSKGDAWVTIDRFYSDKDGAFTGELADFGDASRPLLLRVDAPGRAVVEQQITLPGDSEIKIAVGPRGTLEYITWDQQDVPMPAKISLYQEGELKRNIYSMGQGSAPVPPGTYDIVFTRGFEYQIVEDVVEVPDDGKVQYTAQLWHFVETEGWLSVDTHVHAAPSPDSRVLVADRLRSAAVAGLDVVVATDHEYISDYSPQLAEAGLEAWVATVSGQEVTASIPEHTQMYPVVPDSTPRSGFVRWYQLDLAEIFAAERDRGAGVVNLNHPRKGCNYLCLIGWDREAGAPTLDDPTLLGLAPGATLWDWSLDSLEYMNGFEPVFVDEGDPEGTGIFDDWQSFLNHGHHVTATGVSDVHGLESPGSPRSYFPAASDDVQLFDEAELVTAVKQGQVVVSAGAFATVSLNGAGMGETATVEEIFATLDVHVEALPEVDVSYLKVFVNCDEIITLHTDNPGGIIKHDGEIGLTFLSDAHVVVMGFGEQPMPRGLAQYDPERVPRFTTNPIYVDGDNDGEYTPPGGKQCEYTVGPPA